MENIQFMNLILDNGACDIKVGFSTDESPITVPNCIARSKDRRVYIADELDHCKDYAGLTYRRPHDRGQLISWECEKAIWDGLFYGKDSRLMGGNGGKALDAHDTSLILTETPYTLPALSSNMDQIVFEEYGFSSYYRCTAGSLVSWNNISELYELTDGQQPRRADCTLVIDFGFSATHVVPVIHGQTYWPGVRRINVGGKQLTNFLKETVSFRHYNMMEETFLLNVVKQRACYVSQHFSDDLEECQMRKTKSQSRLVYALPDFRTSRLGCVVEDAKSPLKSPVKITENSQLLTLTNERFTIPEALFQPNILGIDQCGVPEAALQSVQACPPDVQNLLFANVVLTGGTSKLPGLADRMYTELQKNALHGSVLRVGQSEKPIPYAWEGGRQLFNNHAEALKDLRITKQEYDESGPNICLKKFGTQQEFAFPSDIDVIDNR